MPQWNKNRIASIPAVAYYNGFKPDLEQLDANNVPIYHPNNIIVLDTETTGLDSINLDEIIQIGLCLKDDLIKNKNLNLDLYKKTYNLNGLGGYEIATKPIWNNKEDVINKFASIPAQATSLNIPQQINLIKKAFENGLKIDDFIDNLADILDNKIIIMQNGINFDADFLNKLFGMVGKKVRYACLDTMSMAYHLGYTSTTPTGRASYTQESLGRYLKVINLQAHNAVYDCVQLFNIYSKMYEKNANEIKNLLKTCYSNNELKDGIRLETNTFINNKKTSTIKEFKTPFYEELKKISLEENNKSIKK